MAAALFSAKMVHVIAPKSGGPVASYPLRTTIWPRNGNFSIKKLKKKLWKKFGISKPHEELDQTRFDAALIKYSKVDVKFFWFIFFLVGYLSIFFVFTIFCR
jgi:hypothetical protein